MLSLPKAQRQAEEEPMPEHIQKSLNEAKGNVQHDPHYHHHSHDHQDDHYHAHAGYADAYGLGDGWSI